MKTFEPVHITANSKFIPKDSIVFIDVENDGIIFNLKDNNFYTLNETATMIWKLLQRKKTVKEVIDEFRKEYESEKNKVIQSIIRQIREFLSAGLAEPYKK